LLRRGRFQWLHGRTRLLVLESAPSLTPEQRPELEQASPLRTHAEPHPPPPPGLFSRHTDLIEPLSLDEAYLDVTENKTGLPTATRVAIKIREEIRQELNLTASAGVGRISFLAKIASDWKKPDGLFVIQPHQVHDFLTDLPIGRIPGVGKVTEQHLLDAGIKTVGDVQAMDAEPLETRFGRYGLGRRG
jgi:DNA polymerase IV